MGCLGVFDVVSKSLGPGPTATVVLPAVTPLLMEPGLNAKQFATFMRIVQDMLSRVEAFLFVPSLDLQNRSVNTHSSINRVGEF